MRKSMSHTDTLPAAERMRRSRARRAGKYVEPAPRIQRADAVKAEAVRLGKSRETVYRHRRLTRNATAPTPAPNEPVVVEEKATTPAVSTPLVVTEKAGVSSNGLSSHPAHLPAARAKASTTMKRKRAENPAWGQREDKALEHARLLAMGIHRPLDSEPALPDLIIGDDGMLELIIGDNDERTLLDKARATRVTLNDFLDDTAGTFETRYFQVPIPARIHNALLDGDMPRKGPEFDAWIDALLDVPWAAVASGKPETTGVPMVGDPKATVKERLLRLFAGLMVDDPAFFRWRQRVTGENLNRRAMEYGRKVRKIRRVRLDDGGWEFVGGLKVGVGIGLWDAPEGAYVEGACAATEGEQPSDCYPKTDLWGWRLMSVHSLPWVSQILTDDRVEAAEELIRKTHPDIKLHRIRTLLFKGSLMREAWTAGLKEQTAFNKREARRRAQWFGEKYVESLPAEVKDDPVTRGEIMAAYVEGSEDYAAGKPKNACPYAASGVGYNAWRKGYEEEQERAARWRDKAA
jgi:hypothetical protein